MNKALLVGINAYPGAPLSGCINDIEDMSSFLVGNCGFKCSDIRMLSDSRATTAAILDRLNWLVTGLKAGDRVLFHYSGHGAQVPTRNPAGELDGLDEVICPVDFDWTDAHLIRDKQFNTLFAAIPAGVEFVWVSDSCHSGDLSRDLPPPGVQHRRFPVPADIRWRQITYHEEHVKTKTSKAAAAKPLNVALISGCKSDQTSADAVFNGRPNGALTYFLLKALKDTNGLKTPLATLVPNVAKALNAAHYTQVPQLEGSATIGAKAFLG